MPPDVPIPRLVRAMALHWSGRVVDARETPAAVPPNNSDETG
jgi:hypothetical protein